MKTTLEEREQQMELTAEKTTAVSSKTLIILSFLAVYIIWGSTYIGIKFAIETFPPFLMAGIRFLIAGSLLYLLAEYQHAPKASIKNWKTSSIIGFLLLFIGNGGLVWASQRVNSGIAALLITIEPIWVVILQMMMKGKQRPGYLTWLAMVLAFTGMILLVGPSAFSGIAQVDLLGFIIIMISSLGWAAGSLYAANADLPASPVRATSLQMISGSLVLILAGTLSGEWTNFSFALISVKSWYAFLYLILFGSIIGYSAYSYLTKAVSPGRVSTYAYVNPVVAVFLGTFLGGEQLHLQTILAALLLISAVVLILVKAKTH